MTKSIKIGLLEIRKYHDKTDFLLFGNWISFDKTGIMAWDNIFKKNRFWIYNPQHKF